MSATLCRVRLGSRGSSTQAASLPATSSRRSTSRKASSPASEDSEPPSKRAVTALPFTGDRPGSGGVVSCMAGLAFLIRSFWRQQPKPTTNQRLGLDPPTLVHNPGYVDQRTVTAEEELRAKG